MPRTRAQRSRSLLRRGRESKYRTRSARADPEQNDFDRLQQHHEVEGERVVLDVVEVVLELLARVLGRGTVAVAHLRPAGDARLDEMPLGIEGNGFGELLHEGRALRPRADEAHVAEQHVEKL